MTLGATQKLARYAVKLRYGEIPSEVISRAKACFLDTIAVTLYGSTKPWSRSVIDFVKSLRANGASTVFAQNWKTAAPQAALANGAMAHAFELDNVRQPGGGVHPGATAFLPALAAAEERKVSGQALLVAFVAGCEVMSRIGVAAGSSLEKRGFHAPALTGTFGAAVAAGRLLRLDERKMVHALGIAGSYSGGLLEFSRCREGAMIKRLHLGKAAEGGVNAALLAERGFAGPESVLEGEFGFCRVFSTDPDLAYLTHRLGQDYETLNLCIKRYACHINAHAPIEALQRLLEQNRFSAADVKKIVVAGMERLISHHAIYEPADLMAAQYSVPFCLALSLYHDPRDPGSFNDRRVRDKKILDLARRIELREDSEIVEKHWDRAARVSVELRDGRTASVLVVHFRGTPQNFLSAEEIADKARRLTASVGKEKTLERLIETVDRLEKVKDVSVLSSLLKKRTR